MRWRNSERLMVSSSSRGNAGRSWWSASEVEVAKNGDRTARDRSWPAHQPHGYVSNGCRRPVGSGRNGSILVLRTCKRSESVPIEHKRAVDLECDDARASSEERVAPREDGHAVGPCTNGEADGTDRVGKGGIQPTISLEGRDRVGALRRCATIR